MTTLFLKSLKTDGHPRQLAQKCSNRSVLCVSVCVSVCFLLKVENYFYRRKHVRGLQSEKSRRNGVFLGKSLENGRIGVVTPDVRWRSGRLELCRQSLMNMEASSKAGKV